MPAKTKLMWLLADTELPSFLLVAALSALASFRYIQEFKDKPKHIKYKFLPLTPYLIM